MLLLVWVYLLKMYKYSFLNILFDKHIYNRGLGVKLVFIEL